MIRNGLLFLFLMVSLVQEANAARQYRCEGKVQYRPCEDKGLATASGSITRRAAVSSSVRATVIPVDVESPSLLALNSAEGLWKGAVRASGKVHLMLQFHRNGEIIATRYMGNITLTGQRSPFTIRSALPEGNTWSWRIVAYLLNEA